MAKRGGEVSVIIRARDVASSVIGRFRRNLSSISRTAKDVTRAIVVWTAAIVGATLALTKLATRGSKIIAVKRTFAKITGDEVKGLNELREASRGTIADFDLMSLHNQALALGSAKTTEEFARQVEITRVLGRAQGLEATESLQKFTVGMARLSRLRLDDLGITLKQEEANTRYAAIIGKNADALDEEEKKIAFRTEAMRQALELVERLGTGELKGAEAGNRFATAMQNIRDGLSEVAAESPAVEAFFDSLTSLSLDIIDVLAGDSELMVDAMKTLGRLMGDAMAAGVNDGLAAITKDATFGRYLSPFLAANAELSRENLKANRDALASIAAAARAQRAARSARRGPQAAATPSGTIVEGVADPRFTEFEGSRAELSQLLARIRDTRAELRGAQLEKALAPTEEAAKKAREEVDKLADALRDLQELADQFGGEAGLGARFDPIPGIRPLAETEKERRARLLPFGLDTPSMTRTGRESALAGIEKRKKDAKALKEQEEALEDAAASMERAQAVTVAAMFGIGQAAIAGTEQVTRSVVSMITQMLQASTESGILGAVFGGVGGLVMAALGREDAVPVRVDDYSSRALAQMRDSGSGPIRITTIIEQGGIEIERIERELLNRQATDTTVRLGGTVGMGS